MANGNGLIYEGLCKTIKTADKHDLGVLKYIVSVRSVHSHALSHFLRLLLLFFGSIANKNRMPTLRRESEIKPFEQVKYE